MTFSEAKQAVLLSIKERSFMTDDREKGKNALADGTITLDEAHAIVSLTRGQDATQSEHHMFKSVQVWVFRPADWYVKFHIRFGITFISFHQ